MVSSWVCVVVVAEAPEEAVETRSLYEQLQAQKDAKQLEYDEQHRLSTYILPSHLCLTSTPPTV